MVSECFVLRAAGGGAPFRTLASSYTSDDLTGQQFPYTTISVRAGGAAIDYFQQAIPGASDTARSDNEAEWIVNLTTRVRLAAYSAIVHLVSRFQGPRSVPRWGHNQSAAVSRRHARVPVTHLHTPVLTAGLPSTRKPFTPVHSDVLLEHPCRHTACVSVQADRAGQAEEFAQLYEASSLRRENDSRLEQVRAT